MVTKIRRNLTEFFYPDGEAEDIHMGRVLQNSAIFVDTRDENFQYRFLPLEFNGYTNRKEINVDWYWSWLYYDLRKDSVLACCSDLGIAFHYVNLQRQHLLDYLINIVQPFGIRRELDVLPRKLQLQEIIDASDADAPGKFRFPHKDYHDLEPDELY